MFYAYAYPEPEGFSNATVDPLGAGYNLERREFIFPYDEVRHRRPLMRRCLSLQSGYEAAAESGAWDRAELEQSSKSLFTLKAIRKLLSEMIAKAWAN